MYLSCQKLQIHRSWDDFFVYPLPVMTAVVAGHHLYGQPDPYPDGYTEKNETIKMLQITLSIADKIAAATEYRPEITDKSKDNLRQVMEQYKDRYVPAYTFSPPDEIKNKPKEMLIFNRWQNKVWQILDDAFETIQGDLDVEVHARHTNSWIHIPGFAVGEDVESVKRKRFAFTILNAPYQGDMFVKYFIPILRNNRLSIKLVGSGAVEIDDKSRYLW